jgi:hypothetical protein
MSNHKRVTASSGNVFADLGFGNLGDGTAGDIDLIWVRREREYFLKWGWTGQIKCGLESILSG